MTQSTTVAAPQPSPSDDDDNYDYYRSSILWLFVAPALGGFLFGYDIGGTSYVILQLSSPEYSKSPFSLKDSPLKTGWFVSAPSAGALLGTAVLLYMDHYQQQNQQKKKNRHHKNSKTTTPKGSSSSRKWLAEPIGRRDELFCAGILYAIGGLLQCSAAFVGPLWWFHRSFAFVLVSLGRWIYGAGIGFAMHGGPTYLAETTPPSVRGMVVGAKEIAIVVGILSGYVMGNNLCTTLPSTTTTTRTTMMNGGGEEDEDYNHGWAYVYGSTVLVAIAMIAFSKVIPESARFLVSSNHHHRHRRAAQVDTEDSDALFSVDPSDDEYDYEYDETERRISSEVLDSLQFVWKPKRAKEEHRKLMEIFLQQQQQQDQQHEYNKNDKYEQHGKTTASSKTKTPFSLFSDAAVRPALKAGLGLVVLQQVTGQPSVLSYATPILARVPGLTASASILLAVFKVLATSVSVVLVEHHGRKTLLVAGCSLMLVALMVLAVAFQEEASGDDGFGDSDSDSDSAGDGDASQPLDFRSLLALAGMFAYIAGYQIGFGPITWLMISEVFPQSIRGTAVALAVQANFALNALVQFLVPVLQETLGMSVTFAVFGCLTAYSLWFVKHSVPETRGLTLEQIEDKLAALAKVNASAKAKANVNVHVNAKGSPEMELLREKRRRSCCSNDNDKEDGERVRLLPSVER